MEHNKNLNCKLYHVHQISNTSLMFFKKKNLNINHPKINKYNKSINMNQIASLIQVPYHQIATIAKKRVKESKLILFVYQIQLPINLIVDWKHNTLVAQQILKINAKELTIMHIYR